MEAFRQHLQQEFLKRTAKNENYSLRAFAGMLELNHGTLSGMLAGKRTITKESAAKIASKLGWGPEVLEKFSGSSVNSEAKSTSEAAPYHLLKQDAFAAMSEWYFDAVLEFTKIAGAKLEPKVIAGAFGISEIKARFALETLKRLELLILDQNGRHCLKLAQTTNILDPDFTTAAQRKYQNGVLEKSIEALEAVPRAERDHTSMTIAIDTKDLPEAKQMIGRFRKDLDRFLQRAPEAANEVYQLQVSFFPLSHTKK